MRVLFLTLYPESGASSRYRVHQFLPYLRERGVECRVECPLRLDEFEKYSKLARDGRAYRYHFVETTRRLGQLLRSGSYDIVFLQKAIMTVYLKKMSTLLRWRARRVVFDIDDAVNLAPPAPLRGAFRSLEDPGQANEVMAGASLVLAGNRWLASAAEASGARVEVFPTVVDTDRFRPGERNGHGFTVGWIGSPSTSRHLRPLADALSKMDDADVRLVGADPDSAMVPGAAYVPWSSESEVAELQRMSVGLMPLPKTDWSRGKCALKALQYMSCGVPCVATPFGAIRDVIRHEENGLYAESEKEWIAALNRLRDPEFRGHLGEQARRSVEEHFSLAKSAPRLAEHLESVM